MRVNYQEQNPSDLRILISIGDYYEQTGIFIFDRKCSITPSAKKIGVKKVVLMDAEEYA